MLRISKWTVYGFTFLFLIVSTLIELFIFRYSPTSLPPTKNRFSGERAAKHWKVLTQDIPHRFGSTAFYNFSYQYVKDNLQIYQNIANERKNFNFTIFEQSGHINENRMSPIMQYQTDVRNLFALISPFNNSKPPIMLSGHLDSKNTGPGAYDDCAAIVTMLEIANTLVESNLSLKTPILLFFVGTEELGLHGSTLFLQQQPINITSYMNLEGLGAGPPFAFVQKGVKSKNAIKAWMSRLGALAFTFPDDVLKIGAMHTLSDASRFMQAGLSGGEAEFLGNPSSYHSPKDVMGDSSHLQLSGDSALTYILNYNDDAEDCDVRAVGVSPFLIMWPSYYSRSKQKFEINFKVLSNFDEIFKLIHSNECHNIMRIMLYIAFVVIVIKFLFRVSLINVFENIAKCILAWIGSIIVLCLIATLLYYFNPLSYGFSTIFASIILTFVSVFSFVNFLSLFEFEQEIVLYCVPIIIDLVLFGAMIELDLSLFPEFQLLLLVVNSYTFIMSRTISAIINFIMHLPFLLFWILLLRTVILYAPNVDTIFGELSPMFIVALFPFVVLIPFLPFSCIKQQENKQQQENNHNYWESPKLVKSIFYYSDWIAFFICIFYLVVISYPFGGILNIPVIATHVVDKSGSFLSISPEGGQRFLKVIKNTIKDHNEIQIELQKNHPMNHYDCLFKNISYSLPDMISEWPQYKFHTEFPNPKNANEKNVTFTVTNDNPGLHKSAVIVKCKTNQNCVTHVPGFSNLTTIQTHNETRFIIRQCPAFFPHNFSFTVNSHEPIMVDVTFSYNEYSNELKEFMNEFPHYVIPFAQIGMIGDTLLVSHDMI
ncbi:hypothetical protein TRFO_24604 [Tritrichomonas foetus]|uniref:Peptidase M28 domain-containing protein n=1 Tax=Tritrichomonas foetus TaxID=1144522 RepID=A0A1J4KC46_9EUKA|nr:hypothetical protein TRFO_24604 [Tritrichomonas foetus]|eukprot:OHT07268.1 hypothetical protein TRFO_24604 [Tritrichomonas foetus]